MFTMDFDVNFLWLGWFALAVAFFLIEIFTPTFIIIFFSAGALFAGCAALLDQSLTFQVVTFFCASVALLTLLRKQMPKIFGQTSSDDEVFKDAAINATAIVVESISSTISGRVKYQGTFWNAEADEAIPSGSTVTILARKESDPNTFIVKKD
ncbi:NfeD family protein [Halodesulfovibrio marinisediminis]|uniref:Membrane protein implicated in regulation of membrane protease activity n=1 Tax=Halodesulfovibrio marinisediminis DSM 17456 TaxID=1121457 RepID=A0A1N6FWH7_9BACT|nr:NfeD family protein [Halodesulfovibrio marinisediminis]SIN99550.1 Membrane protein implicated in regulation of membrane protease activity [Halodesulfovibrio marinisediminis DSM 17456]